MSARDHLWLVDGSGFIFRAYHALPPLTRKSDGLPTGAISGFCNMLWKLLSGMPDDDAATHMAVIFDAKKKTFRNDIYPEYKANRPPVPTDLVPQLPLVRTATRAFGLPCIEMVGFEADDLIATYARLAREAGKLCTIVSSDKDLMQLVVADHVRIFDPMKYKPVGVPEVVAKFGVTPSLVADVQALAGDSIDNVPGVPGIGLKTAAELINAFGPLEALLARADEVRQPKRRAALLAHADKARISKRLVLLDDRVPTTVPLGAMRRHGLDDARLVSFLEEMEFAALIRTVMGEEHHGNDTEAANVPDDRFSYWRQALEHVAKYGTLRGADGLPSSDAPQPGYYRRRLVRGGPWVPVVFWLEGNSVRCRVQNRIESAMEQWTYCCGGPITEEYYKFLMAEHAWARRNAPADPVANPDQPVDLMKTQLPF